jgi:hypothetical protein
MQISSVRAYLLPMECKLLSTLRILNFFLGNLLNNFEVMELKNTWIGYSIARDLQYGWLHKHSFTLEF